MEKFRNWEVSKPKCHTLYSLHHIIIGQNTIQRTSAGVLFYEIFDYDFEFKNDVALVFIINSLNKKEKQNKLHAVFFNTNSREILLSTPLVTGPEGFGFRNYWIGSIHNVLKILGKNEYKKWKKLYKKWKLL